MSEPIKEWHAITRARKHYGLELTTGDLIEIQGGIAAGRSVLMSLRSSGKSVHIVRFKGIAARVVVNSGGRIMTFLPASDSLKHRIMRSQRGKKRRRTKDQKWRLVWNR